MADTETNQQQQAGKKKDKKEKKSKEERATARQVFLAVLFALARERSVSERWRAVFAIE